MGILDIFSQKPAAVVPATPAAPASTAAEAPAAHAGTDSAATPDASTPSTTPLDSFNKLWETDATNTDQASSSVFGDIDPKKIFEAAKGSNFAGAISPEVLQAITAGGDGAATAFQQAINASTQAAFAQAMIASTKLIEQAITKTNAKNLAELPGLVKRHAAADSLQTENPALSNPAAAPIVAALQAQLALKHPNATATELKKMAQDYLGNFADVVKPTKPAVPVVDANAGMDWSKFLAP